MAGLLDLFSGDAGLLTGLALMEAGSAKPVRTSTAGGLLSALTNTQQMLLSQEDRKQRQKMQALQEQQLMQALAAQQAQQEQAQKRLKYLGSVDPSRGPALEPSMAAGMAAGLSPQEVAALSPQMKAPEYKVVNGSLVKIAGDNVSEAFRAPEKPQDGSPLAKLIGEMNALPPGHPNRRVYEQAIAKATTHQPAVQNINYGTPMPAINPATGKVELVRPDNKGGMSFTGVEPPPQNRDTKLPAEIQRMNIAADSMVSLLGDYEKWLAKNNPRDPTVQMSPARRAEMQSLMKNIQLQYKELAALGALAGPDLALMEAALTDPFTFKGAWYGPSGLRSQITQARNLVDVRRKAIGSNSGGQQQAQPADDDPLGLRK